MYIPKPFYTIENVEILTKSTFYIIIKRVEKDIMKLANFGKVVDDMNDFFRQLQKNEIPFLIDSLKQVYNNCIDLFKSFPTQEELRKHNSLSIGEEIELLSQPIILAYRLDSILNEMPTINEGDIGKNEQLDFFNQQIQSIRGIYNLCKEYREENEIKSRGIDSEATLVIAKEIERVLLDDKTHHTNKTKSRNRTPDDGFERGGGNSKPRDKQITREDLRNSLKEFGKRAGL